MARKFFLYSTAGVDEIGGYVLAVSAAVGFAYGVVSRAHVRVDLFLARCPAGLRGILEFFAALGMAMFAYWLLWRTIYVLIRTISLNARASTPLHTPLIYPQGAWTIALALFALVATIALWRALGNMLRGELPAEETVSALDEEIHAETADAKRRLASQDP